MTSAFLTADEGADELQRDLAMAGVTVFAAGPPTSLLRDVLRAEPQILVARHRHPVTELLPALAALREHAALPVLLFTADGDTDTLSAALEAGVDVCVVNGYAPHRLRTLMQLARLRFERERRQHQEMATLSERFEERKLVDRAKGILTSRSCCLHPPMAICALPRRPIGRHWPRPWAATRRGSTWRR